MNKIDNSIETRRENYPPKFYQVLEKIDLIMQNWIGEKWEHLELKNFMF